MTRWAVENNDHAMYLTVPGYSANKCVTRCWECMVYMMGLGLSWMLKGGVQVYSKLIRNEGVRRSCGEEISGWEESSAVTEVFCPLVHN